MYVAIGIFVTLMVVKHSGNGSAVIVRHHVARSADTLHDASVSRTRFFHNPGWLGGAVDPAGADARYLPKGRHIIADVYHGDPDKLNDMEGMLENFQTLLTDAGLHVLSSAGHQLAPQGVSVTITIEESHLTVHTWPEHRAALVDVFTCGSADLLPVLPALVATLGAQMDTVKWSLHHRGEDSSTDLQELVLKHRWLRKSQLAHLESANNEIDVWRVGREEDPAPPAMDPVSLYLNGTFVVSTLNADAVHEGLVHPAFVIHRTGVARIAVLGGDTLASAREVLKYASVKAVDVLVLDPAVPPLVRTHLPQLDNCSTRPGATLSCTADRRVEVHHTSVRSLLEKACKTDAATGKYDAIVVDLAVEDVARLVSSGENVSCSLREDGIVVSRVGSTAPPRLFRSTVDDTFARRDARRIGDAFGATATFFYAALLPSLRGNVNFALSCRNPRCLTDVQSDTTKGATLLRARTNFSGASPFRHFDGSQFPHTSR